MGIPPGLSSRLPEADRLPPQALPSPIERPPAPGREAATDAPPTRPEPTGSPPERAPTSPSAIERLAAGPSTVARLAAGPSTSERLAAGPGPYERRSGGYGGADYPWNPGGVVYAGTAPTDATATESVVTLPASADTIERRSARVREEAVAVATQGERIGVDDFIDFAAGESAFGALNERERGLAVDAAIEVWMPEDAGIHDISSPHLVTALVWRADDRGEIGLRDAVTSRYAERAVEALEDSATAPANDPLAADAARQRAARFAGAALYGLAADPIATRALVDGMDESTSLAFVDALSLDRRDRAFENGQATMSGEVRAASAIWALANLATAPMSERQALFARTVFTALPADRYGPIRGETRERLGLALGTGLTADISDPAARRAEAARLGAILATDQGAELLGLNERISAGQRLDAIELVRTESSWTAATFAESDSVWSNPTVMEAFARPRAEAYLNGRGDTAIALPGTDLENQLGFALGLPPDAYAADETAAAITAREAAAEAGGHSYYAHPETAGILAPIAEEIRAVGGTTPEVTIVPVQFSSPEAGVQELVIFRVVDPARPGEETFVDATGARFSGIADWRAENELPPGFYVMPEDGHLQGTPGVPAHYDPPIALESEATHATVDTFAEHALQWADRGATTVGLVAGGAILLGSGGTLAPVVFGGAAAWQTLRAGERLLDRYEHHRPLGLSDAGARRDWLELGAGLVSAGSAGYVVQASRLSRAGAPLAELSLVADRAAALGRAGSLVDGATALNDSYGLVANWNELDGNERAALALSIGFWTSGAAIQQRVGQSASRAAGEPPIDPAVSDALYDPDSLRYRWLETHEGRNWPTPDSATYNDPSVSRASDYRWTDTNPPIRAGHVVEGHLNRNPDTGTVRATGWHHRPDGVDPDWRRATPLPAKDASGQPLLDADGQAIVRDGNGVYRASVELWDPITQGWVAKDGKQTFFPDHLSESEILDAVSSAHTAQLDARRSPTSPELVPTLPDGRYTGASGHGFDVRYYLETIDGRQRITSAYPIFDPTP